MHSAILTAVIVAASSFILQKTLSNLMYGLIIFITKPLKKGDKVSIKHFNNEMTSGKVVGLGPLHIKVKEYNRDVCIIPNSLLETCVVVNSDYKNGVNYINKLKVSFSTNFKKVEDIILSIVINNNDTQNTLENTHLITKIDSGGVIIEYNVRTSDVDRSFDVCSDITQKLVNILSKEEGVELL